MTTARTHLAGAGIQTSALAFGGVPAPTGNTEEWSEGPSPAVVTITTS
jgi:hypothetical protein